MAFGVQIPQSTRILGLLVVTFLLIGCASTTVTTTGLPLKEPLCQPSKPSIPTVVYWGTKWRPDQKEPKLREAAAMRGIQDFLSRSGFLLVLTVNRLAPEQAQASNEELMHWASSANPKPDRIVRIVVRELGPRLLIGIPVIVEGGTEVVVEVNVLDAMTSQLLANTQTTWRNGGPFVIKGIKTLEQDMSAALAATLMVNGH